MRYSEQPALFAGSATNETFETTNQPVTLHGEALARDLWLERYGSWIVICFIGLFAILLLALNIAGQIPGQSFLLKDMSDVFQTGGQWIGFFFCLRMALKLRHVVSQLNKTSLSSLSRQEEMGRRAEIRSTERAWWAWFCLAIGIALYGSAGVIWTSYDVRMATAQVPYPGLYDIGYVAAYPFFLIGTILLARRSRSAAGRTRLLLDALAIIGTSIALSWFFLLGPSIASLSQSPSPLAAVLALYFPAGDLLLIAIGVLLLFSPLSTREQEPVLLRLCLGLSCLATADSLLGYFNLTSGFNTGTLMDVLWPLSLLLVGLAAVEYPRSIAREQEQGARQQGTQALLVISTRFSQLSATLQAIVPIFLTLLAGAILLLVIAPRSHTDLIAASVVALLLVLIVIGRQTLTLLDNNRLTMQVRGELVVSRRELQVTQIEANKAEHLAQENQELTSNIKEIQQAHTRIAHGDFTSKAPQIKGPLMPLSISFNLMQERLNSLARRTAYHEDLLQEIQVVQRLLEQMRDGTPGWPIEQIASRSRTELRAVFLALADLQRAQNNRGRRLQSAAQFLKARVARLREVLIELGATPTFASTEFSLEKTKFDTAQQTMKVIEEQVEQITASLPSEHRQNAQAVLSKGPAETSFQQSQGSPSPSLNQGNLSTQRQNPSSPRRF